MKHLPPLPSPATQLPSPEANNMLAFIYLYTMYNVLYNRDIVDIHKQILKNTFSPYFHRNHRIQYILHFSRK